MRYILLFYAKIISPLFPGSCRFYPCCSSYALGAYKTHGFLKGTYLSLRRIAKCHPYHKGPCIDEVPPKG